MAGIDAVEAYEIVEGVKLGLEKVNRRMTELEKRVGTQHQKQWDKIEEIKNGK